MQQCNSISLRKIWRMLEYKKVMDEWRITLKKRRAKTIGRAFRFDTLHIFCRYTHFTLESTGYIYETTIKVYYYYIVA